MTLDFFFFFPWGCFKLQTPGEQNIIPNHSRLPWEQKSHLMLSHIKRLPFIRRAGKQCMSHHLWEHGLAFHLSQMKRRAPWVSPHAAGFWGSSQLRLDCQCSCQCSCSTRQDAEGSTRLTISAWALGKLAWVTERLPQTCPHLPFQIACIPSRVQLCVTLRTVAHQAPLSVGSSRQEYWSGLPFPYP